MLNREEREEDEKREKDPGEFRWEGDREFAKSIQFSRLSSSSRPSRFDGCLSMSDVTRITTLAALPMLWCSRKDNET
jgi:hypothetical protein